MRPEHERYLSRLNLSQDYLVREFVDNYQEGVMSRRDMMERIFRMTGGSTAATAGLLLALGVKPAFADPLASVPFQAPQPSPPMSPFTIPEGDPDLITADVTFPANDGATIMAYVARPRRDGTFPAVMICHENTGTAEHFRDVARRYAKNGYVGTHIDLLSRQGGTAAVPTNEIGAILSGPGAAERWIADFQATMAWLRQQPFVLADRIGMTGFCFGGGVTLDVATREPTLRAAVPYYGTPSFPGEVANIRAAVLALYGELDGGTIGRAVPVLQPLAASRSTVRIIIYPGAAHAFFNDTRPFTGALGYVESAATAAWRDTLAWFGTYLRSGALPATGDAEPAGSPDDDAPAEAPGA
jgi:carboxymethylenebutenolidase